MDPVTAIGLSASIEQLAAAAGTIFYNLYTYYEAVRDAPSRSQELRQEMLAVADQLNAILAVIQSPGQSSLSSMPKSFTDSIGEFDMMLKDMNERLMPSRTSGLSRLKWPFTRDENERILSRMERYKSLMNSSLNIHAT